MNRRDFICLTSAGGVLATGLPLLTPQSARAAHERTTAKLGRNNLCADVVIAGGGLGGCAAALAALRAGRRVIMTEETDWIGGQLTQQGVPPDENQWVESYGATRSYRELRTGIRDYYRRHYPLTEAARANPTLNPGAGSVSRLCHEPRVALAVLDSLLAPYLSGRQLILLLEHKIVGADVSGNAVQALQARSLRSGRELALSAPYFIDATELGDLLPLTGTEFVMGTESRTQTGEPHAPEKARPLNQQSFTVCFAMDYLDGENHVIEKPKEYGFWREYVPPLTPPWSGRLLSLNMSHPRTLEVRPMKFDPAKGQGTGGDLWLYRRIAARENFRPGAYAGDITIVNWPQNDYIPGPLVGVSEKEAARHVRSAKQLSLSLLYWLQTEAPRPDGGTGFPGLRLRGDILGTEDGLAKYPYIREARRIQAEVTVVEQHIGRTARAQITGQPEKEVKAEQFPDSVGLGHYNIDLHPSTGGDNYIDILALPFQIPLGALLPKRVDNLLPAAKNLGVTHITNGCYREHPTEWNIGESAGLLAAFALEKRVRPREVRARPALLAEFQGRLRQQGVEIQWPAQPA